VKAGSVTRIAAGLASLVAVIAAGARPATAQDTRVLNEELRRLRAAAAHEAAGDYSAAEHELRSVLDPNPTSLNALLALERILMLQGRLEAVLPAIDTLLLRDPSSVVGHQMRVRAYSMLNRDAELEHAAEAWMRASPRLETPYREVARIWRSRGEWELAVRALERGRRRVGRPDALALELGDAHAQAGDAAAVIREWTRAIGPRGEAFLLVHRRLGNLPDAGASIIPGLVDGLMSRPTTPDRMKSAIQLAIDAGLGARAQSAAAELLRLLNPEQRPGYLIELGRRADGAGLRPLALWAYSTVVDESDRSQLMLALRSRVAELALALGDTARAAAAWDAIAGAYGPGSPEKRQALSLRVQVLAREGAHDSARAELARLAHESEATPEMEIAAAALANALIDAGHLAEAENILATVSGPHVSYARGRAYMARGDVERARSEILAAAPRLDAAEATEALGLATLLGRLSVPGGDLLGRGVAAMAGGDDRDGILLLYDGSERMPAGERAAILDFAASLADRAGLEAEAEQIRRDIVAGTPHAPEAPLALLALARGRLDRSAEEARLLLERLIVDYPRSALVPQAQRELERLVARTAR